MLDGKIYKLQEGDLLYIGSTIMSLADRLYNHRMTANKCASKLILQANPQARLELLEEYPCETQEELRAREQEWMDKFPSCLNFRKAYTGLTPQEYHKKWNEDNKEKEQVRLAQAYQANREAILTRRAEKITCGCGSIHRRGDTSTHLRTANHLRWAEAQP